MKLPPNLARKCRLLAGEELGSFVVVPVPPSVNNLFNDFKHPKTGRKMRVPTREYLEWRKAVDGKFAAMKPPTRYPCEVVLTIVGKVNEQRDGSNLFKAILDQMVREKVLIDDNLKYVRKESIEYCPEIGRDGMVKVEIREADRKGEDLLDLVNE